MPYQFYTCDVFTESRFGGNPLAVLPDAIGLSVAQMQQIAREFNYSETAFVFPASAPFTRQVRIFTPTQEVPFAGHPNIGTAYTLASIGEFGDITRGCEILFDEQAGPVPISIEIQQGNIHCELRAPEPLSIGAQIDVQLIASALNLSTSDIAVHNHPPQVASVGLPFILVELADLKALKNARSFMPAIDKIYHSGVMPDIFVYVHSSDEFNIRARMFAPLDGVPEDPATGSANCALVAMLSQLKSEQAGEYSWRIAQGVEMQRPSVLAARALKQNGVVNHVWVGGTCQMVTEGVLQV